jgi:hypothetical protein
MPGELHLGFFGSRAALASALRAGAIRVAVLLPEDQVRHAPPRVLDAGLEPRDGAVARAAAQACLPRGELVEHDPA